MEIYIFTNFKFIIFYISIFLYILASLISIIWFLKSFKIEYINKQTKINNKIKELDIFINNENINLNSKNLKIVKGENYFWWEFQKIQI